MKSQRGFTLIEILVALVLIAFVVAFSINTAFNYRDKLDKAVNKIEQAVRFSPDESVLRNTVIRIHFLLNRDPQEWAVEYGPSENFVMPSKNIESENATTEDPEAEKKEQKKVNLNFNKIQEFQEKNEVVPDEVKIIGVGSTISKKLLTNVEHSIYFYPTGEKDESMIILGTQEELVVLTLEPFQNEIEKKYYPLAKIDEGELFEVQKKQAQGIFDDWLKEKK